MLANGSEGEGSVENSTVAAKTTENTDIAPKRSAASFTSGLAVVPVWLSRHPTSVCQSFSSLSSATTCMPGRSVGLPGTVTYAT